MKRKQKIRPAVVQLLTGLIRWNNWRTFEDLTLHRGNRPMLSLSWGVNENTRKCYLLATEAEIRKALLAARRDEAEGFEGTHE